MTATIERLIGTLEWFGRQPDFSHATVAECHPTTSDDRAANDLVLTDTTGRLLARVEVCDVVSSYDDGNNKEPDSLRKLGCSTNVPDDGTRRFIGTSREFARYLLRRRRAPPHYTYVRYDAGDGSDTAILELVRPDV